MRISDWSSDVCSSDLSLWPRRGGRHRTFGQWAAGARPATLALHAGPLRRMEPWMSFVIVLAALCFLMFVAYRGHSVLLFSSEEHTSELQSLMCISYVVFCL